ncbi:hypothetical protein BH11MYX3_BH11MYX3_00380 [soil metagenome]
MKLLVLAFLVAVGCGGPSRTSYARYPGAPIVFDRATSTPETLEIADKVLAAHGGAASWEAAKQIRWKQTVMLDGKATMSGEQAWDRWNERHWAKLDRTGGGAFAVIYDVYGAHEIGYIVGRTGGRTVVPSGEAVEGVKIARKAWQRDMTATLAPFLMFEPGAKLELVGMVKDGEVEMYELKLAFDPNDTARAGLEVHLYCDKDKFLVSRVTVRNAAGELSGYTLGNYQAAGGLQIPTERKNLGNGETTTLTDVKVSAPDDDLFIAPVS